MKIRKNKNALLGLSLILGVVMVVVSGQSVLGATLSFVDDFNYVGVPDNTKWDGPWGDVAVVNGEYGSFGNTTYSQKGGFVNPVESVTIFEYRRPSPASGNVTVRLYDAWPWSGIGVLEITTGNVQIDALQSSISMIIAQVAYDLDAWYTVAVKGNADNTTEIKIYERDSGDLVDAVSFWHDACGPWNFHFAAAGTSDLDNVMIFSGSMSWDLIDVYRVYGPDVQIVEDKVFSSATSIEIAEGSLTPGTYDVGLLSAPSSEVTVDLSWNASQITVSPAQLVFDPNALAANAWNVPQTITVEAVDDEDDEGDHFESITHDVSSADAAFNAVSDFFVQANIEDNDVVQVSIVETDGTTEVDEADPNSDDYTVTLGLLPTGEVQITVSFDDEQIRCNAHTAP